MILSNASLKERLAGWTSWDIAIFHLGTALGFWPEFGAPPGEDQWRGVKGTIWSANTLGDAMASFLEELVKEGCLERHEEPDIEFRWNPNYKGAADIISTLEEDEKGAVIKVGYLGGGMKLKIHYDTIEDVLMDYPNAEWELSGVTYQGQVQDRHLDYLKACKKDGDEFALWKEELDKAHAKGLPPPPIVIHASPDTLQQRIHKWLQTLGLIK